MADESAYSAAVHPLVLINISDLQTRLKAQGSSQPGIGMCLGTVEGRKVVIENSFVIKQTAGDLDREFVATQAGLYAQTFEHLKPIGFFTTTGSCDEALLAQLKSFSHAEPFDQCHFLLCFDAVALASGISGTDIPLNITEIDQEKPTSLKWSLATHDGERIAVDHVSRALNTALEAPAVPKTGADDHKDEGKNKTSGVHSKTEKAEVVLTPGEQSDLTFLHTEANALRVLQSRLQLLERYLQAIQAGSIQPDMALLQRLQAVLMRLPERTQPDAQAQVSNMALEQEQEAAATEVAILSLLSDMTTLSTQMKALVSEVTRARGTGTAGHGARGGYEFGGMRRFDMDSAPQLYE